MWSELGNLYEVNFVQNEIKSRVKYDASGNIVEATRYYGGDMLPLIIQSTLHNRYPGKKVFGVTEVAKDGALSYYIVLEDDKSWINVKSDYFGQISVQSKYRK